MVVELFRNFYANKAIKMFSFEKTSPSPTLPFCMKICRQITEALLFLKYFDQTRFFRNLRIFFKTSNVVWKVDKISSRILWTWPSWHTCPGWYCNPQFLQLGISTNSYTSPLPLCQNDFFMKNFSVIFIKEREFWNNATHIHLTAIVIAYHDGNCGCNSSLPRTFLVGIPSWMGF
jgi:hypothetical protein